MNFISQSARQRSKEFEGIVGATTQTLEDPRVRQVLGEYGSRLLLAANQLVLPNIRHGKLTFPLSKLESDSFALVPLRSRERFTGLAMDASMYEPAQRQRGHHSESEIHQYSQEIAGLMPRSPVYTAVAWLGAVPLSDRKYVSRPTIYANPLGLENGFTPSVARTNIHELVHADDANRLEQYDNLDSTLSVAADELHAYRTEATIERATETSENDPNNFHALSRAMKVEVLSQRFGDPSTPDIPTEGLVEAMQDWYIIP